MFVWWLYLQPDHATTCVTGFDSLPIPHEVDLTQLYLLRKKCKKNKRPQSTGPPTPRLLCKFKYLNHSVITSVRSVEKAYHTSNFTLTSYMYHPETKNFIKLKYKKGHNSCIKCRKIVIIELELDIHKVHIHTTPSFNPTFRSQVIRKPIWDGRYQLL